MQLPITLIQQEAGSMDCQIATALMRLRYCGNTQVTFEDLCAAMMLPKYQGVRHTHVMIRYLRELGFQTFFAFHEGAVIDATLENKSEKDIALFTEALAENRKNNGPEYQRTKLELLLEYAEKGGLFSTTLPTLATIEEFLERKIPVELGVEFQTLHLRPTAKGGSHSILVFGKEGDSFWVHDPMPSTPGTFLIHKDRLLHAWYKSGAYMTAIW